MPKIVTTRIINTRIINTGIINTGIIGTLLTSGLLLSSNAFIPEAKADSRYHPHGGAGHYRHTNGPHGFHPPHPHAHHPHLHPHPHHMPGHPLHHGGCGHKHRQQYCTLIPAGEYDLNNATMSYGYDARLHVSYMGEHKTQPVIVMRFFQPGGNAEETILVVVTPGNEATRIHCHDGKLFINWDNVTTPQGIISGKLALIPEEGSKALKVLDSYLAIGTTNKQPMRFEPLP